MNLQKLFDAQKVLRERIDYNESDRFEKLVLALLVEIGELANEWRGFKFWSKDQKPRTKITCTACHGIGEVYQPIDGYQMTCPHCDGKGVENSSNPLLEEYVDGEHFILELGIELELEISDFTIEKTIKKDVTEQFIVLNQLVTDLWENPSKLQLIIILEHYLGLGEMLGFTPEQIENAYFSKNQINHQRQEEGY